MEVRNIYHQYFTNTYKKYTYIYIYIYLVEVLRILKINKENVFIRCHSNYKIEQYLWTGYCEREKCHLKRSCSMRSHDVILVCAILLCLR